MFFGAQSFSSAPFASEFVGKATVLVNGNQINITIGNATTNIREIVPVTGNQFNLATGDSFVISWNPIAPGATQIWTAIDPDNP